MADHLNDAAPTMKHAAERRMQWVAWDLVLGAVAAAHHTDSGTEVA